MKFGTRVLESEAGLAGGIIEAALAGRADAWSLDEVPVDAVVRRAVQMIPPRCADDPDLAPEDAVRLIGWVAHGVGSLALVAPEHSRWPRAVSVVLQQAEDLRAVRVSA